MEQRHVSLTREELYEKVWTTPMRNLAREFGLSDVGLKKVCRRHFIPTPGVGHWRQLETGHRVRRIPLKAVENSALEIVKITIRESPDDLPDAQRIRAIVNGIVVSDQPISHPLALRTQRILTSSVYQKNGRLSVRTVDVCHVKVSQGALPRALGILDALLHAFDKLDYQLSWPQESNSKLTVKLSGEPLEFSLLENPEHVGCLVLTIPEPSFMAVRRRWSDGKIQRLEKCLASFILGLNVAAKAVRKHREYWEAWEREQEEERRAEREEAEHSRKGKFLEKMARAWHDCELIRNFAREFDRTTQNGGLDDQQERELRDMIVWAVGYADRIDPKNSLPEMLDTFWNGDDAED